MQPVGFENMTCHTGQRFDTLSRTLCHEITCMQNRAVLRVGFFGLNFVPFPLLVTFLRAMLMTRRDPE